MATFRTSVALTLAAAFAVLLTLVGYQWPNPALIYVFRPLATLILIFLAVHAWQRSRSVCCQWIVVGLCFSLVGDILLIWPNRYFLAGLAAFLLTHASYLVAFTRDCKFPARWSIGLVYLAVAAGFFALLYSTLPVTLRIPVAIYAVLLSTMAGQAMGRSLLFENPPARWAALGALFFMTSDLLLALHRFRKPLLHSTILILVSYYTGQWLIAWSTLAARPKGDLARCCISAAASSPP